MKKSNWKVLACSFHISYQLPASYELFGDYVLMCHPVPGFGSSLPRMCVENEKVLVNGLLKELNIIFK